MKLEFCEKCQKEKDRIGQKGLFFPLTIISVNRYVYLIILWHCPNLSQYRATVKVNETKVFGIQKMKETVIVSLINFKLSDTF
jgi:hypothetical protein